MIISQLGALQGILLATWFLVKSRRRAAMLWFGLYVFIFSTGLMENWLTENTATAKWTILLAFVSNSSYLYGPFLYLFIFCLANNVNGFSRKNILHFIPFLVFFFIQLYGVLAGYKLTHYQNATIEIIEFEILVVQILTYNILAIRTLNRHCKNILQTYPGIEEKDLGWLRMLLLIITGIYIFSFVLSHLMLFGVNVANLFVVIKFSITFCIYLVSYLVLFNSHLFALSSMRPVVNYTSGETAQVGRHLYAGTMGPGPVALKYKRSGLKPQQAQKYHYELQKLMVIEKPYKNPGLNIGLLSAQLGISKNHLTQVLNEQFKMNFFELINTCRTDEAKQLLLNPEYAHLTIEGIAKECGFKSRTTFYINFKKITGLSPQEWIKKEKSGEI